MKENAYAVDGMKCVHCKANVENALKILSGVAFAEANLEDANVTVEYNESRVSPPEIKEAVDNSGRYELSLQQLTYTLKSTFYAPFICRILPPRW